MSHMERREFIALIGGGGLLLTVKVRRARGQQPAMPVVGFLSSGFPRAYSPFLSAFRNRSRRIRLCRRQGREN
jgi:hypothetical protein